MIAYTVITNGYDTLHDPIPCPGWDYVCFSDQPIRSGVWDVRRTDCYDRYIKINGHRYFHDLTLYVDGSVHIVGDLNEFVASVPQTFTIWKHPRRECIYEEGKAVVRIKRMPEGKVREQMLRYASDGFPRDYGLGANGIMLRNFSNPDVIRLSEIWWDEFLRGVPRDQLSLMYCFWQLGMKPDFFDNKTMNKYFKWHKNHPRPKKPKTAKDT